MVGRIGRRNTFQFFRLIILIMLGENILSHKKSRASLKPASCHNPLAFAKKVRHQSGITCFDALAGAIDNREDDILDNPTAKTNTEFLIQKVLSAFAFALENAATENYYSTQTDIPSDTRRLLYCLNNCKYTQVNTLL